MRSNAGNLDRSVSERGVRMGRPARWAVIAIGVAMAGSAHGLTRRSAPETSLARERREEPPAESDRTEPTPSEESASSARRETSGASESKPPAVWLGAVLAPVSDSLRERYGFRLDEGAVVVDIASGSPADRYHLPLGGVIVDMGGAPIRSPRDAERVLQGANVGDTIEIAYFIREQRHRVSAKLGPAPAAIPVPVPPPHDPGAEPRPPASTARPGDRPSGSGLENALGRDGRRPLLGRLGRVLDGVVRDAIGGPPNAAVPPDAAVPPEGGPADPVAEAMATLVEEVRLLRREIDMLRARVEAIERKQGSDRR